MLSLLSQVPSTQRARSSADSPGGKKRRSHPTPSQTPEIDAAGSRQAKETEVVLKIASRWTDLQGAFELVYENYLQCGLTEPNPYGMRVTPYQLLPTTEIFVATREDEIISTLSLVRDGELGLPMESCYPEEVASRRDQGLHLAEVSCLANRRLGRGQSLPIILRLMTLMAQCAQRRGVNQLLIAVHPHHAKFYHCCAAFDRIGEERSYEAVQGKPAVAMALDLDRAPVDHPALYRKFFGVSFPESVMRFTPIPEHMRSELQPVVEVSYDAAVACPGVELAVA